MDKSTWIAELRTFAADTRQRNPTPDRSALSAEDDQQRQIIGSVFHHWGWNDDGGLNRIQGQREILGGATDLPTIVFSTNWPGLVAARELLPEDPASPVICLLQSEFAEFNQRMLDQAASHQELPYPEFWGAGQDSPDRLDDRRTHLDLIGGETGDTSFDYAEFCVHVWNYFVQPKEAEPEPVSDDDDDSGGDLGRIEGWPSTHLASALHRAHPEVSPHEFRLHVVGDLWGPQAGSSREHLWRWDGNKLEMLREDSSLLIY